METSIHISLEVPNDFGILNFNRKKAKYTQMQNTKLSKLSVIINAMIGIYTVLTY